MTEEEARTTTCHQTLVPLAIPEAGSFYNASACVGQDCMAWRWEKVANPDWKPTTTWNSGPQPNPYGEPRAYMNSATEGYCGLAGQS